MQPKEEANVKMVGMTNSALIEQVEQNVAPDENLKS